VPVPSCTPGVVRVPPVPITEYAVRSDDEPEPLEADVLGVMGGLCV